MSRRIREHIRSNVIGYIALFFALGGGAAWATHPGGANTISTGDIQNNQVFSADVRNDTLSGGGLGAADLQPNSVGTSEAANNSLTGNDILESSLGKVGDANTLDGLDSTSFVPDSKLRRVGPIGEQAVPGTIQAHTIATVGHFSFVGACGNDVAAIGDDEIEIAIASDVAHSTYRSQTQSQAGGQFVQTDMHAGPPTYAVAQIFGAINSPEFNTASGIAVAPDGQQVSFDVYQGWFTRSQDECIFGGTFVEK